MHHSKGARWQKTNPCYLEQGDDDDDEEEEENSVLNVTRHGSDYAMCHGTRANNVRTAMSWAGAICQDALTMVDYTGRTRKQAERVVRTARSHSGSVTLYYILTEADMIECPERYHMPGVLEIVSNVRERLDQGKGRRRSAFEILSLTAADLAMRWWIRRQHSVHCELAFHPDTPSPNGAMITYSVTVDGVRREMRTYKNTSYSHCSLMISTDEERRMRAFLDTTVGLPLDVYRSRLVPFWPSVDLDPETRTPRAYWCAMLCVAAMQVGGFFTHVSAHSVSVDDVVRLFEACRSRRILEDTPTLVRLAGQKAERLKRAAARGNNKHSR